ncbi:ferredoxin reductase [Mesorhizobium sp. L-8-10]|uniref:NAD(P)/FAD-dependent oxidoreductase n=1 Tax=Mesorhizobium sp. L-8-10 TaxID=2744523 RepID=UPI0019282E34|nr:FAD-dependent oxidoreductase [Mesorhizobium sp. L-8-10]BCH29949.1 ferredoxin reductase [Mesorhizobium sp. L-8-10]
MSGMVIIGGGECGGRAALALREAGYEGSVTLVGAEPHLPYERPPLSKEVLVAETAPDPRWIGTGLGYEEAGIRCITGLAAAAIDRAAKTVTLADGATLAYDRLLLATGAAPRRLAAADMAGPRIAYLRSYADALALRDHLAAGTDLAIIGAGFIGLELAASARRRGVKVTVIEAQPRILMRGVPEPIAAVVAQRHRDEGVDLRTACRIAGFAGRPDGVTILLEGGERIDAGLVVVGIGALPVTGLAEAAGLAVDNGVVVDRLLATSDPDIFAAGDCCSFPLALHGGRRVRLESWRSAQEQGALAAHNMLGTADPVSSAPWFWSDQYELSLQVAGLADGSERTVRRDLDDQAFILFHLDAGGRLVAASGIGPGNAVARDIRLAEMLIARGARPSEMELASLDVRLKALLAA